MTKSAMTLESKKFCMKSQCLNVQDSITINSKDGTKTQQMLECANEDQIYCKAALEEFKLLYIAKIVSKCHKKC